MTEQENEKTEQTAVAEDTKETPTEEVSADSGTAQGESLDDLLKEFDAKREPAAPPQGEARPSIEPTEADGLDATALATLEKRLNDQESREARRDLEQTFSKFSDGVQADDVDAEVFLNTMASRDTRINTVYQNRAADPKAWADVEKVLVRDFQNRYGKAVDKQVTESREAVASAVRSASTAAPQRDLTRSDIESLSTDEFAAAQRKLGVNPV